MNRWKVHRFDGKVWYLRADTDGIVYGWRVYRDLAGERYELRCAIEGQDVRTRELTCDRRYALIELERMGRVFK